MNGIRERLTNIFFKNEVLKNAVKALAICVASLAVVFVITLCARLIIMGMRDAEGALLYTRVAYAALLDVFSFTPTLIIAFIATVVLAVYLYLVLITHVTHALLKYTLLRVGQALITFMGIITIVFFVIHLIPADPIELQHGGAMSKSLDRKVIERVREQYNLDKPIHIQYILWWKKMVTFDFGTSIKDDRAVMKKIQERLPVTLTLNILSMIVALAVALPLGIYNAAHAGTFSDRASSVVLFLLYSLPTPWVALMLIVYLGVQKYVIGLWFFALITGAILVVYLVMKNVRKNRISLRVVLPLALATVLFAIFGGNTFTLQLPIYGLVSDNYNDLSFFGKLVDLGRHLVLPLICYTYGSFAFIARLTRGSFLDTLSEDFIKTATAKGLTERQVLFKHALRNSLIPIVTIFSTLLPSLIGGSVIIEKIFSIPGMGLMMFDAIRGFDYPVVMTVLAFSALLTLFNILIVDISYIFINPRISFAR